MWFEIIISKFIKKFCNGVRLRYLTQVPTAQVRLQASVSQFIFCFFLGFFIYFFFFAIDRPIVSAYLIPPPS